VKARTLATGLATALAATVLVAAGCGDDEESGDGGQAAEGELTKVEMMTPVGDSLLYPFNLLGKSQFYAEEGLEVTTHAGEGAPFVVQQLVAGRFDFGLATSSAVITGLGQGGDLKGVGQMGNLLFGVFVPEDSPLQSIEELDGKTVGIPEQDNAGHQFLKAILTGSGIDVEGVDQPVVGSSGPGVVNALKTGRIDAYNGTIADAGAVEAAEGGVPLRNIVSGDYDDLPGTEFVITGAAFGDEAKKDIAVRMLRAWRKATEYAQENPEQSLEEACEIVPEQCENMDSAAALWADTIELIQFEEGAFGAHNYEGFQTMLDDIVDTSVLDQEVDIQTGFVDDLIGPANE
jgi:NitT/TauT family transport system substrate-binding protein